MKRAPVALVAAGLLSLSTAASSGSAGWKDWDYFANRFVQQDGRVVDLTFEQKSTSEGQSYGLFFALVANQRQRFDTILAWTSDNLAGGRLGERLPAWLWGRRDDGSWGVKDDNAAADGDLWLAYSLLEAGRLWNVPAYSEHGRALLRRVREREVVTAGSAGTLLLPGPVGFALDGGRYRVDPSYIPGFMFRYFAKVDPDGPWQDIWDGLVRLMRKPLAAGVAPDLFVVDERGDVQTDTQSNGIGSYDAIRVYLWAGMSGAESAPLLKPLAHYAELTRRRGAPPEKVDSVTGRTQGPDSAWSPIGFSGALLPYLSAIGDQVTLDQQRGKVERAQLLAKLGGSTNYYDEALILFGKGWLDGRYSFDRDGRLNADWGG
ncbi:MAG TPA: cellulose synthase complex periplasmic endoglucanase BcsZ [Nevskia sp.]|nr:cellulose synthase complex periplasmic endoglucanase BcsZ [Nevskia sp.]